MDGLRNQKVIMNISTFLNRLLKSGYQKIAIVVFMALLAGVSAHPAFARGGHSYSGHSSHSSGRSHSSGHIHTASGHVNSHSTYVHGYTKKNGTHVNSYHRTKANRTKLDNYSTKGNTNPYTGKAGTIDPNE